MQPFGMNFPVYTYVLYFEQPNEYEWRVMVDSLYFKTGIPHVVGAVDGKHNINEISAKTRINVIQI